VLYNQASMRAFYTSVMALLVVAALFWGNCYSCPQVLLAAASHGCCHRSKAPKTDCQTQGLRNFVKAEKAAPVSSVPMSVAVIAPPAVLAESTPALASLPTLFSPPLPVPLRI
jgi:hypothetical protein